MTRRGAATYRQTMVLPGRFQIVREPDEVLVALLGSCVSVCLRDRVTGIGGMNHIMLPDGEGARGEASMAGLVTALQRGGAAPAKLEAKLFGGAAVLPHLPDIGAANLAFVCGFLSDLGIAIAARDVGGTQPRRLWFHPASGRSVLRRVTGHSVAAPRLEPAL